jgi:hypothetical protein
MAVKASVAVTAAVAASYLDVACCCCSGGQGGGAGGAASQHEAQAAHRGRQHRHAEHNACTVQTTCWATLAWNFRKMICGVRRVC